MALKFESLVELIAPPPTPIVPIALEEREVVGRVSDCFVASTPITRTFGSVSISWWLL